MDLSNLDTTRLSNDGVAMPLRHPVTRAVLTHDGRTQQITMVGMDSDRWREAVRRQNQARIDRMTGTKIVAAELEEEKIELLAAAATGWSVFVDGSWAPFSPDAVLKFYRRFPWAMEDADRFIASRADFLPPSGEV
jgi:hypothetical protein